MGFLESLAERVFKKRDFSSKKQFRTEYRMLGGELVDEMLVDLEKNGIIEFEGGWIKNKRFIKI